MHIELGPRNFKSMRKAIFESDIRGILDLKVEEGKINVDFEIGRKKKTKMSYNNVMIYLVLELFHMDTIRPIQIDKDHTYRKHSNKE